MHPTKSAVFFPSPPDQVPNIPQIRCEISRMPLPNPNPIPIALLSYCTFHYLISLRVIWMSVSPKVFPLSKTFSTCQKENCALCHLTSPLIFKVQRHIRQNYTYPATPRVLSVPYLSGDIVNCIFTNCNCYLFILQNVFVYQYNYAATGGFV